MAKKDSSPAQPQTARFVLLPLRGLRSPEMRGIGVKNPKLVSRAGARLTVLGDGVAKRTPTMNLLHSMGDDGPKLVEMGASEIAAMRVSDPGVRAVPLVKYEMMRLPVLEVIAKPKAAAAGLTVALSIGFVDQKSKLPIAGVTVAGVAVVLGHHATKLSERGLRRGECGLGLVVLGLLGGECGVGRSERRIAGGELGLDAVALGGDRGELVGDDLGLFAGFDVGLDGALIEAGVGIGDDGGGIHGVSSAQRRENLRGDLHSGSFSGGRCGWWDGLVGRGCAGVRCRG